MGGRAHSGTSSRSPLRLCQRNNTSARRTRPVMAHEGAHVMVSIVRKRVCRWLLLIGLIARDERQPRTVSYCRQSQEA